MDYLIEYFEEMQKDKSELFKLLLIQVAWHCCPMKKSLDSLSSLMVLIK